MVKEADFNTEIVHLMAKLYYWPITGTDAFVCQRCGHVTRPKKGRPDILALGTSHKSLVIECKMVPPPAREGAAPTFELASIEPKQRRWLTQYDKDSRPWDSDDIYRSYLALCTSTGTAGSINTPRRAWLIPWMDWLLFEFALDDVKQGHKSIPLYNKKGQPRALQTAGFCLIDRLTQYELEWWPNEEWWIKESDHPLYLAFGSRRKLEEYHKTWKEEG